MKELTVFEMEYVSGGDFSSDFGSFISSAAQTVTAAVVGGTTFAIAGTILGGRFAGSNGGLIGFGLIGNAVGCLWGLGVGAVGGAILGAANGLETAMGWSKDFWQGMTSGTMKLW